MQFKGICYNHLCHGLVEKRCDFTFLKGIIENLMEKNSKWAKIIH